MPISKANNGATKVLLKPTQGVVRSNISITPSDRRVLDTIIRAYETEKGISPSQALVYSIALNLLASEVRRGNLPSHQDLRPCHP
jgi:type IV secretory pathway VirB9-like protein